MASLWVAFRLSAFHYTTISSAGSSRHKKRSDGWFSGITPTCRNIPSRSAESECWYWRKRMRKWIKFCSNSARSKCGISGGTVEPSCCIKLTSDFSGFVRVENRMVRLVPIKRTFNLETVPFVDLNDVAFAQVTRCSLVVNVFQLRILFAAAFK